MSSSGVNVVPQRGQVLLDIFGVTSGRPEGAAVTGSNPTHLVICIGSYATELSGMLCIGLDAMAAQTKADGGEFETLDSVQRDRRVADALDELAGRLGSADSIAEDVPLLSELYHEARTTGGRRLREGGKWTLLVDFDDETGDLGARSLHFLEQGAHLRDTGADAKVSASPQPFQSVDEFIGVTKHQIERTARSMRQNATERQHAHEEKQRLQQRDR